ncbi:MAG: phosphatidylglycerophosphatase A [Candidatus Omnitrophica bacterium]|nr:phosphatidylglycerophosphatase A [Candidatus Omnitrophota bacterium]
MTRILERVRVVIATSGGVGYLPRLPGTAGTLVGTALAVLGESVPAAQWGMLAAVILLGLWAIPAAQRRFGRGDPHEVVVDEVAGALVTFLGVPLTPAALVIGFVAFRLLDIIKPPPIRQLERLPGAWGVLADDLAAGLLANLLLRWLGG